MTASTTNGTGAPGPGGLRRRLWRRSDAPSPRMPLGVEGFTYADLYDAGAARDLLDAFDRWFAATAPEAARAVRRVPRVQGARG